MAFSPAFLDELAARNPIEDVVGQYVALTRRGSNLFGLCPFHSEKTASFSVAPDKGIYYCFGCHKGGGAINFVMELEGLSYPDAVRKLAQRAGHKGISYWLFLFFAIAPRIGGIHLPFTANDFRRNI